MRPHRLRRVVELRFYEGLSQAEIAERIGVSQMQISRLLARALAELRHGLYDETAPAPRADRGDDRGPQGESLG